MPTTPSRPAVLATGAAILFLASKMAFGGIFDFGERPLGSDANKRMAEFLRLAAEQMGYETTNLPFKCVWWTSGPSFLDREGAKVEVFAGPYSPAFDKRCDGIAVSSTGQLKRARCEGKIVFLRGEIAREPLMPLDYPFYFPDAHKEIYALLDERRPAAVVAVTGKHPASGQDPHPLIDDAAFRIPSAYMTAAAFDEMMKGSGKIRLKVDSKTVPETGEQVVARKRAAGSKGKIAIFAHMDSAYGTPGALDNAAGVAVLLRTMIQLKDYAGPYDLEFIPFNGEESPMAKGQLAYLDAFGREMGDIRLAINIDAVGAKDSKTAVSTYNMDDERKRGLDGVLAPYPRVERGPEWVEGDHSIFVFQGIPCIALTSSNLREGVMAVSHTPNDTVDGVDLGLLVEAADFIAAMVKGL